MKKFSELLELNDEEIIKIYLDWFNNFLTLEKFAEHYGIDETDAFYIIEVGRKINNDLAINKTL